VGCCRVYVYEVSGRVVEGWDRGGVGYDRVGIDIGMGWDGMGRSRRQIEETQWGETQK